MHGHNKGHITPYTDIEFQLTKYHNSYGMPRHNLKEDYRTVKETIGSSYITAQEAVPCRCNTNIFLQNPHKRHPMRARSFVSLKPDICSAAVIALLYVTLCNIASRYKSTQLYFFAYSIAMIRGRAQRSTFTWPTQMSYSVYLHHFCWKLYTIYIIHIP